MMDSSKGSTVVLTSFGPFGGYCSNPSESVMQAVQNLNSVSGGQFNLVCECMPVSYTHVPEKLQLLWNEHRPKLMVHLGVGVKGAIYLETQSFSKGYCKKDIHGRVPSNNCCCIGQNENIKKTALDVDKLVESASAASNRAIVCSSKNPGRYLCAYSYYYSLSMDASRSLFVHIPADLDIQLIAAIVFTLLQEAITMVDQNNSN